jgi:hypothetical protein
MNLLLILTLSVAILLVTAGALCDKVARLQRQISRLGQPLCAEGKHTDGQWELQPYTGGEARQCQICGRTEWRMMTGLRYTAPQQQQQAPRR